MRPLFPIKLSLRGILAVWVGESGFPIESMIVAKRNIGLTGRNMSVTGRNMGVTGKDMSIPRRNMGVTMEKQENFRFIERSLKKHGG